jgi:NADPH2:quinone reductase
MKAAVYYETGAPEVFRYEEVPDPVVRPGGIVFDVRAISIEGGDVLNRAGGAMMSHPHVVGYQAAGIVQEVGEGVLSFTPGQRVVATMPFGSHAGLVSVPARSAYSVPENMDMVQAACVPIAFGTAHDCLFEFGRLKAGETVLVQAAAGGVGLAAIQLAKRAGARVLGTASSDEKLERLKAYGLDLGINYRTSHPAAAVMAATDGQGVNLVVDSVGGHTLEQSIACLAYRGRLSWVGNAGREQYTPVVAGLMQKNARLNGIYLGGELEQRPERTRAMIHALLADCATGALKVVVDRTFALSEAAAAHAYIESRSAFGRVALVPER